MENFNEQLLEAIHRAVISTALNGDFHAIPYDAKFKFSQSQIDQIYSKVDFERISVLIQEKLEETIADKVVNQMATEISTDVKTILSNAILREELRGLIRNKMNDFVKKLE